MLNLIFLLVKNGHRTTDVQVYLLGHENGKQCIVNAAKNVCKVAVENPAMLQNFHAKQFENFIKGNFSENKN